MVRIVVWQLPVIGQGLTCGRKAAHDGADWHRQHFRRFPVGQPFDIHQKQRVALGRRQPVYAPHHFIEPDWLFTVVCIAKLFRRHAALPLAKMLGANFIEPDGVQDGKQPAIQVRTGGELRGALQRTHAGRLHQIVGDIPPVRKHQRIAPQAGEIVAEFIAYRIAADSHLRRRVGSRFRVAVDGCRQITVLLAPGAAQRLDHLQLLARQVGPPFQHIGFPQVLAHFGVFRIEGD